MVFTMKNARSIIQSKKNTVAFFKQGQRVSSSKEKTSKVAYSLDCSSPVTQDNLICKNYSDMSEITANRDSSSTRG